MIQLKVDIIQNISYNFSSRSMRVLKGGKQMNFSINEVDQVIERTGCSYSEAKEALMASDGSVIDAIIYLEKKKETPFSSFFKGFAEESERTADSIVSKISELIKTGNVTKIEIRDPDGKTLTSVSVNVGAAIGSFALIAGAAPLAAITALIARYGLNYQFVVVKQDGSEIIL